MKISWKMGHLLFWSKCSIFHNIFKYMIFQRCQKVLLWSKGLKWKEKKKKKKWGKKSQNSLSVIGALGLTLDMLSIFMYYTPSQVLFWSKCSIFHNIFKYMIFQRCQKVLLWSKGLKWKEKKKKKVRKEVTKFVVRDWGSRFNPWHAEYFHVLHSYPIFILLMCRIAIY